VYKNLEVENYTDNKRSMIAEHQKASNNNTVGYSVINIITFEARLIMGIDVLCVCVCVCVSERERVSVTQY
jgi:hypothetical protein